MRHRFCVYIALAASISLPHVLTAAESPNGDHSQQVRQLTMKYRMARTAVQRRTAVLKELVGVGDEGAAAAKDLVEQELKQIATQVAAPSKTAAADEKIDSLRKVLAELRKDPNLSHDQLEKVGLPALDEINALYKQRAIQGATQAAKAVRLASQLQQLTSMLEAIGKEKPPAGLTLDDLVQKAAKLRGKLVSPEEEEARRVAAANAQLASQLESNLVKGMEAVNAMRIMLGLRPLVYDLKLCEAARGHSGDMAANKFFAHESPLPGKRTPWDRAKLAGAEASGENIFMGSDVSTEAIKAWFLSPGHHKNMLNDENRRQGLGRSDKYWTQMFGR
jgi:uncharacterized protein YkwD